MTKAEAEAYAFLGVILALVGCVLLGAWLPLWLALVLAPILGLVAIGLVGEYVKRHQ